MSEENDGSTAPEGNGSETEQQSTSASANSKSTTGNEDSWDEAAARRKFDRMKSDLDKAREQIAALKPVADAAEKRRKDELPEIERLKEQNADYQRQLAAFTAEGVRRDAAEAANLPAKFVKFITASDPKEALEQAKELAAALKTEDEQKPPPRPDLRQGARGPANTGGQIDPNDLLRQMARNR